MMLDAIQDALKGHLRDMKVRYSRNPKLVAWLDALAYDAADLAARWEMLNPDARTRVRRLLARQAELVTEYVRVQEAKALQATFRAVLLAAIRTAIKLAA